MPAAKSFGSYPGRLVNASTSPVRGIHHHRGAVEAAGLESFFGSALQILVDGQLHAAPARRRNLFDEVDLAPHAVHFDEARAVLAHQQLVVDFFYAGLPDDRAASQAVAFDLPFARLADISKQVGGKGIRGVLPRRHFFDLDIRQLGVEAPRQHGRHLRERRVVHNHDWTVGRFTAMALDDIVHVLRIEAGDLGKHADRPVEILGVLADDGDGERAAVFDQDFAVAIEHDTARRAQRDGALVVVLGQLLELLVLDDLQVPEAERENGEHHGKAHL